MNGTAPPLQGVIPALLTPLSASTGMLDREALTASLESLVRRGVGGVFVGGTMGEGPLLTLGERRELAEAAIAIVAGRVPVAVHVGALATRDASELARHAAKAGADAIASVPPFYYPYDDAELTAYYATVAAAAPALPLYLYNLPTYSRNALSPDLVGRLRTEVPTVVGVKESSGDVAVLRGFAAMAGADFGLICGADHRWDEALRMGASGCVSSGAGVFPELYADVARARASNDDAGAARAQARIDAMQVAFSQGRRLARYKAAWTVRGLDLGSVRPPLRDIDDDERIALTQAMEQLGLMAIPI